jgi:hypothetical protein
MLVPVISSGLATRVTLTPRHEGGWKSLLHGVGHDCDLTVVLQYVIVLGLTVKTALCSIILCGNFSGSSNPNFKNANYIVEVIS